MITELVKAGRDSSLLEMYTRIEPVDAKHIVSLTNVANPGRHTYFGAPSPAPSPANLIGPSGQPWEPLTYVRRPCREANAGF